MVEAALHPEQPTDPAPAFADVGGFRVAYSVEGAGHGPTVVCIAGLPGSARDFRWLAPALTDWAQVVRLDLPGFGASPRPAWTGMTVAEKASTVTGLMERLDLGPSILIGHSFGSAVAARVAAQNPASASHLVLLAPPGIRSHYPVGLRRLTASPLRYQAGRRVLAVPMGAAFRSAGFSASLSSAEQAFALLDSGAADFADYRRALMRYRGPVMVAWAADDRQVPARNSAALADIAGPGPRVAFTTGGHNIQKTRALVLAEMIRSFAQPRSAAAG